jgi:hypothetical protein
MAAVVVGGLILDLLAWLARRDRSYEEVMDAWRTSCPNLPVWEEANERGLVERTEVAGRSIGRVSAAGLTLLEHGRPSRDATDDAPAHSP